MLEGELRHCEVKWCDPELTKSGAKTFLLFNDTSEDVWLQVLGDARKLYTEQRDHFLKFILHPEALTELTVDPLADDPEVAITS